MSPPCLLDDVFAWRLMLALRFLLSYAADVVYALILILYIRYVCAADACSRCCPFITHFDAALLLVTRYRATRATPSVAAAIMPHCYHADI